MQLKLFPTATIVVVFLVSTIGVAAQVVSVSGKVTLKQADGTVVPVRGAVIDIYRTDIAQKFQASNIESITAKRQLLVLPVADIMVLDIGTTQRLLAANSWAIKTAAVFMSTAAIFFFYSGCSTESFLQLELEPGFRKT